MTALKTVSLRRTMFTGLLLALVLIGSLAPAALAASGAPVTVNVAALNVRGGPGTNYNIISVVHSGDTPTAVGQNSAAGWYQIQLADGRLGWVSGTYVTVNAASLPEVAAPAAPVAAPSSSAGRATTAASAAGHHIVFQTVSGGPIYVMNPNGTGLRLLTHGLDPAISPDGTQVAFARWDNGAGNGALGSVWLINIDGTGERKLESDVRQPKSPMWSPDGKQIVINMQQGGTIAPTRQCTRGWPGPGAEPDGSQNGVPCWIVPANPAWGLRLIDVATGNFTDLPRDTHSFGPTWDPADANRIVYHGDQGLVNINLADMSNSQFTNDVDQRAPIFSPDGTRIAVSYRQTDHWEVHVLNSNGSGEVRLTETPLTVIVDQELAGQQAHSWNNAAPAWSPDGKQIAFVTDRSGSWEIWLMNADGSNQHALLTAAALNSAGISLQYNGVDERMISWR
jgi:uncharacterized protein YraI